MSHIKECVDKLGQYYERYTEYVRRNPGATAHLESTVRTLSYLIAGQPHHSIKKSQFDRSPFKMSNTFVFTEDVACTVIPEFVCFGSKL